MKLKDIILVEDEIKPQIHRTFNDFIEDSETPENSIEIDEEGHIVSSKLRLLKFVDWLLKQYDYCPEKKAHNDLSEKPKKKKSKKLRKRKIIKQFKDNTLPTSTNNLDYHRTIGNSQDFNNTPYYNQPFSSSSPSLSQNIPMDSNDELSSMP